MLVLFGFLLLGFLITFQLSGCSRLFGDQVEKTPIELRLLTPEATSNNPMWVEYNQYFKDVGAKFTEAHPNVNIKIVNYSESTSSEELEKQIESSDILFPVSSILIKPWLEENILIDLNQFASNEDKELFYKPLIDQSEWDGKWGIVPIIVSPLAVLYNKTFFDNANLPYPQEGWTWDDFLNISMKLNEANPNMYGSGMAYNPLYADVILAGRGTGLVSEDGSAAVGALDSPASVQGFQWFNHYFRSVGIDKLPDVANELTTGKLFNQGRIEMKISSSDGFVFFKKQLGDYLGLAPLPGSMDGIRANPLAISGIGISSKSKHMSEAWEFIHYVTMTDHEYTAKWADWFLMTNTSLAVAEAQYQNPDMKVFLDELNHSVNSSLYTNADFVTVTFSPPLIDSFAELMTKTDKELPEALHELAQKIDTALLQTATERDMPKE